MERMCCHSISSILEILKDSQFKHVKSGRTRNLAGRDTWSYTDSDITISIPKSQLPMVSDFKKTN